MFISISVSFLFSSARPLTGFRSIAQSKRGFALLITVTLLAFLVLLLVSLAALTRVETQVAANNQILSHARQNALMGLNIAIGQLQRYAGNDARISMQAEAIGASSSNPWFTGIWDVNNSGSAPLAWLVSGNETNPVLIDQNRALNRTASDPDVALVLDASGVATNGPTTANPNKVRLVGSNVANTTGSGSVNGAVVVTGVPINAIPFGFTSQKTIGRYAYWIGDQGVKASLALPDRSSEVNYAPWKTSTGDQSARIRQQISTTPSYFRNIATELGGFDPLNTLNDGPRARIILPSQFQYMTPAAATAPLGEFFRNHYHELAPAAISVLANTLADSDVHRGLLQDLTLKPDLLGGAFQSYANYTAYMEAPGASNSAVPPIASIDSERRRYNMIQPVVSAATTELPEMEFGVAPVLNSFLLQFRILRVSGNVQVRSRLFTELWNPYTSALVPPSNLTMEITGLPSLNISDPVSSSSITVDLQSVNSTLLGSGAPAPMRVNMPFTASGQTDHASWLPGRVYAWVTGSGGSPSASLSFYDKNLSAQGWAYTPVALAGSSPNLKVNTVGASHVITIKIKSSGAVLATYTSPTYQSVISDNVQLPAASGNWIFAFAFRLKQPSSTNKDRDWLVTPGEDMRRANPPSSVFTAFNEPLGLDPEAYWKNAPDTSDGLQNFLLFRRAGSALNTTSSANHDAPLFELPRVPNLSLGELQHLRLPLLRPFAVGNSWGGSVNAWFDRFFFSGVPITGTAPDIAAGVPLPNWNLYPVDSRINAAAPFGLDVLRDGGNSHSSRFLMQAGGVNVNSVSPVAWRAVLSGVRFSPTRSFKRAFIDNGPSVTNYTGSQAASGASVTNESLYDTTLDSSASAGGPSFFRFPQSAQETYFWSNTAIEGSLSKQAFRQGVRGGNQTITGSALHQLTTAQVDSLAQSIASMVREKITATGPFHSIEEFLTAKPLYGGRSLIEKAIADSGINPASLTDDPVPSYTDVGFSSLTLSQADIMTALAPYLRTRSDTFVIRSYGEVINPVTSEVSGRAWCEATVQRFPETVTDTDDIIAPSVTGFGRRFKITHFRWLSFADI